MRPAGPPARSGDGPGDDASSPRLLIVRLSAIGDVLHALPALAALRRARPRAIIDWLVEDRAASLLEGHPHLDRVHVLPRRRWQRCAKSVRSWPQLGIEVADLVRGLVARRYDAALDLQGNLKSGVWTALSGAPARYGFSTSHVREGNPFFTNRHVSLPADATHRVERNLRLAGVALGETLPYADPSLPASHADATWADEALPRAGLPARGYAVLHAGTSGFGAFKRWPPARFARLADRIAREARVPVALTWGPGEEGLVEKVRAASREPLVLLATPSLRALAEVLRRARVVVAADTGPLHLAAAVGAPVVGLFGPKDAAIYGPYGRRSPDAAPGLLPVLVREDVPCRPCTLRWCPEPICMTSIEDDDVYAAALPALVDDSRASTLTLS